MADRHINESLMRFRPQPIRPVLGEAVVDQRIPPGEMGKVLFRGVWWSARCQQNIELHPGTRVYVVDRKLLTLFVEPVENKEI